jgi:N utilization substance protein B
MRRAELREHIFKLLFMEEFNSPDEMPEQQKLYFDGLEELKGEDRAYMEQKYAAVSGKRDEIDHILNENSRGWKTRRMNKVDLSALRLAASRGPFRRSDAKIWPGYPRCASATGK